MTKESTVQLTKRGKPKKVTKNTKVVTFHMTPELHRKLTHIAKLNQMTLVKFSRIVFEQVVKNFESLNEASTPEE